MAPWLGWLTPALVVAVTALSAALLVLVLRSGARTRGTVGLAALLALQACGSGLWIVVLLAEPRFALAAAATGIAIFGWAAFTYLLVLRELDTPLVAPLRRPAALVVAALVTGLPATLNLAYYFLAARDLDVRESAFGDPRALGFTISQVMATLAVGLFALVASVTALLRARRGSALRRRTKLWVLAFSARDLAPATAILVTALLGAERGPDAAAPIWPLGDLFFVPLLAYGILSAHLFDIDLRLKKGIRRSTVAAIGIVAVLIAAKVVEAYLSRTLGYVAGAVAAGIVLFLVPRLNKVGERVADAALPQVETTPEYIAFKKMEVYRAALETVHESGVSEKERRMLERLREKLGLREADARALEAEVLRS